MKTVKKLLMQAPLLFLIIGCLFAQSEDYKHHGDSPHHGFSDAEKWAKAFEDPGRDEWQKPDEVLKAIGVNVHSRIADIGSATGYFSVRFAHIATEGRVFGIDIEKEMVDYLNARAGRESLSNLSSILGEPGDPKIPEKVDIVFICNTYHHIEKREEYFRNLHRYLTPNGRLVIVDFKKGDFPVGPNDRMKIEAEDVIKEVTSSGYKFTSSPLTLPYQYCLVFEVTVP